MERDRECDRGAAMELNHDTSNGVQLGARLRSWNGPLYVGTLIFYLNLEGRKDRHSNRKSLWFLWTGPYPWFYLGFYLGIVHRQQAIMSIKFNESAVDIWRLFWFLLKKLEGSSRVDYSDRSITNWKRQSADVAFPFAQCDHAGCSMPVCPDVSECLRGGHTSVTFRTNLHLPPPPQC